MNTLKTLLTITFTVGLLSFNTINAQDKVQQHVTIQIIEPIIGPTPEMIVVDNNGEIKTVELEKVRLGKYAETFGKNTVTVHNEIKKWAEKGYKILTYDKEPPSGGDYFITNIILVKD